MGTRCQFIQEVPLAVLERVGGCLVPCPCHSQANPRRVPLPPRKLSAGLRFCDLAVEPGRKPAGYAHAQELFPETPIKADVALRNHRLCPHCMVGERVDDLFGHRANHKRTTKHSDGRGEGDISGTSGVAARFEGHSGRSHRPLVG